LTSTATWSSSATGVATVNSTGLAATVAQGSATIRATSGLITGSANLTVTAPALVSIAVTPANPSIALGLTRQFTAIGMYTDSSTQDLTSTVTWSSSATGVATIGAGLATSLAQGITTISASLGPLTGSTALTVTASTLTSIAVTPANNPSIGLGL